MTLRAAVVMLIGALFGLFYAESKAQAADERTAQAELKNAPHPSKPFSMRAERSIDQAPPGPNPTPAPGPLPIPTGVGGGTMTGGGTGGIPVGGGTGGIPVGGGMNAGGGMMTGGGGTITGGGPNVGGGSGPITKTR